MGKGLGGSKVRRRLTIEEQARGLANALRSSRTPRHLRPFIRKRLRELEKLEKDRPKVRRKPRKPGLLDWLGL